MDRANAQSGLKDGASQFTKLCQSIRQLPRFGDLRETASLLCAHFRFDAVIVVESGHKPVARRYQTDREPTVTNLSTSQYNQLLKARQRIGYLPLHHSKMSTSRAVARHLRQSGILDTVDPVPTGFVLTRATNVDGADHLFLFAGSIGDALEDETLAQLSYLACLVSEHLASDSSRVTTAILSRRQTECLKWISKGKTSDEIAQLVGISKHTINNYIANATKKLGTSNRTEAICLAIRQGLI